MIAGCIALPALVCEMIAPRPPQQILRCRSAPAQAHIASLETTEENRAALLMGLEYLLNISFVDDDEVGPDCCLPMNGQEWLCGTWNCCTGPVSCRRDPDAAGTCWE